MFDMSMSSGTEGKEIVDLRCMEMVAYEAINELGNIDDKHLKDELQQFLSYYLNLKIEERSTSQLRRDLVLRELKYSFEQISNEAVLENDGNDKHDDVIDILKGVSPTLSHLEDLKTIRGKLSKTKSLLGSLCDDLDWRVKTDENVGTSADQWGLSLRKILVDMKKTLKTLQGRRGITNKQSILKIVKDDFKRTVDKYERLSLRLNDLKNISRRKTVKLEDLKYEVENHDGNRLRENVQTMVEKIETVRDFTTKDMMSKLYPIINQMVSVLYYMNETKRKYHENLQNSNSDLTKVMDVYRNLNVSLQTCFCEDKVKTESHLGGMYRNRKLQSTLKQVNRECKVLAETEAFVAAFLRQEMPQISMQSIDSIKSLKEFPADATPLEDHIMSQADLLKNIVTESRTISETILSGMAAMRNTDWGLRFGAFKLNVIKLDLLNKNPFSEEIQNILDQTGVTIRSVKNNQQFRVRESLPEIASATKKFKSDGKKSQMLEAKSNGELLP